MLAVIEEGFSQSLNAETRRQILFSNLTAIEQKMLPAVIEMESEKINGIHHSLASIRRGLIVVLLLAEHRTGFPLVESQEVELPDNC